MPVKSASRPNLLILAVGVVAAILSASVATRLVWGPLGGRGNSAWILLIALAVGVAAFAVVVLAFEGARQMRLRRTGWSASREQEVIDGMVEPASPERPGDRPPKSLRETLAVGPTRRVQVLSVVFGVIFGSYVAETLRAPLGFGANHELLFWAFFLIVMAILALLFMCAGVLLGRRRRDGDA